MQFVFVVSGTVLGWAIALGALFITRNIPRVAFIPLHYLLNILVFLFLSIILRRIGVTYTALVFTVAVGGVLLALEIFYWVFVNPQAAAQYLTVIDWIIPSILIFITVYIVSRLVR